MIDGTRHEFTGLLAADGPELVLRLSDTRTWTLRAAAGLERYVGRQVRVSGVRHGQELHVDTIMPV